MQTGPRAEYLTFRERWGRLWPFMFVFVLALGMAWLPGRGPENVALMAAATAVVVGLSISLLAGVWSEVPDILTLVPVLGVCVAVDLIRAASGGPNAGGYGSLLLIPVIWQSLRRRQRELCLTIALVSVANIVAAAFIPTSISAGSPWRSVILFTVVAVTIGQTINRLVRDRDGLLDQFTALAAHDPLTRLPNRRTWEERLPEEIAQAARTGTPLTIAILDLDHFKAYNDKHGHPGGDRLLAHAADAWSEVLRSVDTLARWGGEEFALLLPDTGTDEALRILNRLQAATPAGQTFSAGYTIQRFHPGVASDLDHIMASIDAALYRAKGAGRARSELAHTSARPTARPSLRWSGEVRLAV